MFEVACYNLSIYYLTTKQYSARDIIDIETRMQLIALSRQIATFQYHSENNYFYTPYKIPKNTKKQKQLCTPAFAII